MSHLAGVLDLAIDQAVAFDRKYFELVMRSSNLPKEQLKNRVGGKTEYAQISETVNPIALTTVSNWINAL